MTGGYLNLNESFNQTFGKKSPKLPYKFIWLNKTFPISKDSDMNYINSENIKDMEYYLQDIQNFCEGKAIIKAQHTIGEMTVFITNSSASENPKFQRKGRFIYMKNNLPVCTMYWMDYNEKDKFSNISDSEYAKLPESERALIEAKRQFKYPIDKEYKVCLKEFLEYCKIVKQ